MKFLELKIPPVLIFAISGSFMWFLSLITNETGINQKIMLLGSIISLLAGGYIAVAGIIGFRKAKTTFSPLNPDEASSLVCSGIYRYTRNPMYLGLLFCLFSWACFLDNFYSLIFVFLYLLYMTQFQIRPEEKTLESIFGKNYGFYKKRVHRWL
jgi:protein-S-isoprenylcysteine O-methyltransferase Ste14